MPIAHVGPWDLIDVDGVLTPVFVGEDELWNATSAELANTYP